MTDVKVRNEDHTTIEVGEDIKIHVYSDSLMISRRKWSDDRKQYKLLQKVISYDYITNVLMDMS